jgi:dTDP-4-amino-4,6-dideoxy-D-galactose acyltransferase
MRDYEILEWDSVFFGFRIGKIIPPKLKFSKLKEVLKNMKEEGVKLVYWAADSTDINTNSGAVEAGGFLADEKTTYSINLSGKTKQKYLDTTEIYSGSMNEELKQLALESGIYSRFYVDPHFSRSDFEKLYIRWMESSLDKTFADDIIVVKNNDRKISGMVTVRKKTGTGRIGIIAVSEDSRGKNIGTLLTLAAVDWFIDRQCSRGEVVTQKANTAACHLYEKCGFVVSQVENFYHFWLY